MGSVVVRLRFSCAVRHTPATGVVNAPAIGMAKRAMCYTFVYAPWLLIWEFFSRGSSCSSVCVVFSLCAWPSGRPRMQRFLRGATVNHSTKGVTASPHTRRVVMRVGTIALKSVARNHVTRTLAPTLVGLSGPEQLGCARSAEWFSVCVVGDDGAP